MSDSRPPALRFDRFEVRPHTGELLRDGRRIRLQEQPFQVLAALLERPGELVSREELRRRLWPEDTFVDFDHGLNTAINKLREALRESAAHPRFIETLPRRGYRWIMPVESEAGVEQSRASGSGTTEEPATVPDIGSGERAGVQSSHVASSAPELAAFLPSGRSGAAYAPDLPQATQAVVRALLCGIQVLYFGLYVAVLHRLEWVEQRLTVLLPHGASSVDVLLLATAAAGLPVRLYLFSAVLFNYAPLGRKFARLFPALFLADELWALTPLLLLETLGTGWTLAAVAGLVYLPFAARTLVWMGYGTPVRLEDTRAHAASQAR